MKARRRCFPIAGIILGAVALIVAALTSAFAQEDPSKYPARPIHIIVGFTAGGGNDIIARVFGQKLVGKPRPARHRRKQAGRRRHRRNRICRQIGAGWLHAAGRRQRRHGDQSGGLRQAALRPDPRFRRRLRTRIVPADPDRQCVFADQVGRRTGRLCQGQSGQDQLCQFVGRVPARDRTVQAEDRRADAGHSVQGRQRFGDGRDLRSGDRDHRRCRSGIEPGARAVRRAPSRSRRRNGWRTFRMYRP